MKLMTARARADGACSDFAQMIVAAHLLLRIVSSILCFQAICLQGPLRDRAQLALISQLGEIIFSGRSMASKSSAGSPCLMASSRSVVPFLCAVFAIFAARSYPYFGASAVTSMSERSRLALMLSSRASRPTMQLSVKLKLASARSLVDCQKL